MGAGIRPPTVETAPVDRAFPDSSVRRRVRSPVIACSLRDHVGLCHFLAEIFGSGYPARFQAALEEPAYVPRDRLLLRRAGRVVAHVHVTRRTMQFGSLTVPVAGLQGLATAAHCRREGLGTHLLLAAQRQMAESGAMIGLLRTGMPQFFRRAGWASCGNRCEYAANPHRVLARLMDRGLGLRRHGRFQVRPWRRWEEGALARVYRENLAGSFGMLERNAGYWHWLLERRACDQCYVALDGPDLWDFKESSTRLVGYAAIKGARIVELITAPGRRKAGMELIARACGDAIEQDCCQVALHAPAHSPFREFFCDGPDPSLPAPADPTECCMARLLDPPGLLRLMGKVFVERAFEAGLTRPLELGLLVDGRRYQIDVAGQGQVTTDTLGRSYLRLNLADFTRLVLGQLDWDRALAEDRIVASTALALEAGRALFPALPFWRPPWDDL